ncbi:hypothetical protein PT974_10904 [Cladobotryum mycophilum]|uniref:F-box domain-containing protein n=1 Tax=Cladobotryum mycophilum TaxID=491253 RepID=A0ABR0SC56_9HYPO
MGFDHLPPELLELIMSTVPSLQDLYNIISASPRCFFIFSSSHTAARILRSVVNEETLHHMTAVLRAPGIAHPDQSSEDAEELLSAFLEKSLKTRTLETPSTVTELATLCLLQQRLTYLMNKYIEGVGYALSLTFEDNDHSAHLYPGLVSTTCAKINFTANLSRHETLRLHRGFLRFELFCAVFSLETKKQRAKAYFGTRKRFSLFFSRLKNWEIEEMVCIHQYFSTVVGKTIKDIGDQLVRTVRATRGAKASTVPLRGMVSLRDLNFTRLSLFSNSWLTHMPLMIEFVASRGLDFMYHLIRGDLATRSNMIRSNTPFIRAFLIASLENGPDVRPEPLPTPPDPRDNDPSYPNFAFRTLAVTRFHYRPQAAVAETHLHSVRELGYVFWDTENIEHPLFWEALHPRVDTLLSLLLMSTETPRRRTIGDKLAYYWLPKAEMEKIGKEFGQLNTIPRLSPWRHVIAL